MMSVRMIRLLLTLVAGVQLQSDLRHGEGLFTTSTTIRFLSTLDIFTELEDGIEIQTQTPRPRPKRQIVHNKNAKSEAISDPFRTTDAEHRVLIPVPCFISGKEKLI